jgi:GAF domain-containing protein
MAGPEATTGATPDGPVLGLPAGVPIPRVRGAGGPDMTAPARTGLSRLDMISRLARSVTARLDLADVLAETFRQLRLLVGFTGGSIQFLDDDGWIRLAAADPAVPDELYDVKIPLDSTIAGRIVLTEAPVYVPDILNDERVPSPPPKANLSPGGVRSYFGVPLIADGAAIGLLQIDSTDPDAWDETERLLVVCVAPVVAAAIQNARAQSRLVAASGGGRRAAERWRAVTQLLEGDIDEALRDLAEIGATEHAVRETTERLTAAVARMHAIAAAAHAAGPLVAAQVRAPENENVSATPAQ